MAPEPESHTGLFPSLPHPGSYQLLHILVNIPQSHPASSFLQWKTERFLPGFPASTILSQFLL